MVPYSCFQGEVLCAFEFWRSIVEMLKTGGVQRERQRYYLLAGMGGRQARRKHRAYLLYALIAAAAVSCLLTGLFLWINAL
ncbi:MAG: hypothetical protein MUE94_02360 [Verrucomicrobia bacterium]|nr:hypothetical protein [Verrucomicrobiota bacterium]